MARQTVWMADAVALLTASVTEPESAWINDRIVAAAADGSLPQLTLALLGLCESLLTIAADAADQPPLEVVREVALIVLEEGI